MIESEVFKRYQLPIEELRPKIIDTIVEVYGKRHRAQIEDRLNNLYINMDFLGLNLAQVPTKSSDWKAYIIPILYVITAVISLRVANSTQLKDKKVSKEEQEENKDEKALTKPEDDFDPMAQMNKNMNMMFPVMYLAVALIAPLGLALYWLMNSLLMIIEKLILNKLLKDEEEN